MPIDNQPLPGIKPGSDQGQTTVVTPPAPLKKPSKENLKLQKGSKKLKDIITVRPPIKEEDTKSKSKHSVMAFGRMNPPHAGHQQVVDKVADVAKKVGAKRGRVVVSHSHDKKKNPLDQKTRMDYIKKMNPSNKVRGSSKEHPNFLAYAKKLHKKGTTDLHVVTGSDRAKEFKKTLDKYNNHPDHYSFKSINVHSAGDKRDDKAKGTSGASGTKQREYAKKGDYKSFSKNLPKSLQKDGESMYKKMREHYEDLDLETELTEELLESLAQEEQQEFDQINERVMNLLQRRRAALKMRRLKFRIQRAKKIKKKRMATMDMLVRRARRKARTWMRKRIAGKQGEKYVSLSPSQKMAIDKRLVAKQAFINKMAKRLLPKVRQAELVRLRAARATKENYINYSFGSFLTELYYEGQTDIDEGRQSEEVRDQSPAEQREATDPRVERLKSKHKNEKESIKDKHAIEKEQLTAQMARQKQAAIRRGSDGVSEMVDVMVDALTALDKKAQKADVDLDTLFVEFVEGYNNPHGKQTPQQGGFAAVNKLIAEMSAAEKDKAEDIVKGMKKKASYFIKKYGKDDAKSVMYATANKLAQEEIEEFTKNIKEGGWKGWERFNKRVGKDLEKKLSKARKRERNKSHQFGRFGNVDDPAIGEGMGAAYMPDAEAKKSVEREITSKAVLKQLNRNRNRGTMKGKVRTPNVRYVHDRQRDTDLVTGHRGKTVINPEEDKPKRGHRKKKK